MPIDGRLSVVRNTFVLYFRPEAEGRGRIYTPFLCGIVGPVTRYVPFDSPCLHFVLAAFTALSSFSDPNPRWTVRRLTAPSLTSIFPRLL